MKDMAVEFLPSLASSDQFPPVEYFATPKLILSELSIRQTRAANERLIFTRSGRTALAIAGHHLKRAQHNIMLAPAYHCPAAIEPFLWLGFKFVFYQMNEDLSPSIKHVQELLSQHRVTHALFINYFGFEQQPGPFFQLMKSANIELIHDCAHSMFKLLQVADNERQESAAIICSINKTLPSMDGGILLMKKSIETKLSPVAFWPECKAIARNLGLIRMIDNLRPAKQSPPPPASNTAAGTRKKGFRYFDAGQITNDCFQHTRQILMHSKLTRIRERRRQNYLYLLEHLRHSQFGRPLFSTLDQSVVPYVFPFLLHNKKMFLTLRQHGIQSLRWEEVARTDCQISRHYREHLVQLPCHQQLKKQDLNVIIDVLNNL